MPEVLLPPPKTDPNAIRRDNVHRDVTITAETIQPAGTPATALTCITLSTARWNLDPPFDN